MDKYKQKKKEKHKKIAKKNDKGQPNMASQMDLLLEKIQKNYKKIVIRVVIFHLYCDKCKYKK